MPFGLVLAIDCYYFSKFYLLFEKAAVYIYIYKVKWSRCRPGVAQRVGRGIALLFHDRGTRREWVFISTPRPHFTLGKDPVSILQEAGWAPGPVWMGKKSCPYWDSILDPLTRSQSLYQLSYPSHTHTHTHVYVYIYIYIYIYIHMQYIHTHKFDTKLLQNVSCLFITHNSYMFWPYILAIWRELQLWSAYTADEVTCQDIWPKHVGVVCNKSKNTTYVPLPTFIHVPPISFLIW